MRRYHVRCRVTGPHGGRLRESDQYARTIVTVRSVPALDARDAKNLVASHGEKWMDGYALEPIRADRC